MTRTLLISILITGFIAGTWQVSHAETYRCETIPNQTANCTVDDSAREIIRSSSRAVPPEALLPSRISCRVIYSALQGYTWTGVRGYSWLCGTDITVPDGEFQDKKSMCDKLCGTCDGRWQ